MSLIPIDDIALRARADLDATIEQLGTYLRHVAISCKPEHAADIQALAERVRADLEALGMEQARVLGLKGALPLVAAEWMKAGPGRPTLLVYGHLDIQPVVRDRWHTDPHEPARIGDRLYARGAADDMGGWVSHMAAIRAWLEVAGELPCNIRLVIESEEEIGSPNLERYMDAWPEAFDSDVMILTDCENPSVDTPGLTVSLRGLAVVELACEALEADVHSGLWGGIAPDVSTALCTLVARLVDDDGRMRLGRQAVPPAWREQAWNVPLGPEVVRAGAHLVDGVDPLPDRGTPPAEWLWRQPAVTVIATTLPSPAEKKNALRTRATATLSVRVAPGHTAEQMVAEIRGALTTRPPGGVKVTVTELGTAASSWLYEPQGPAFEAADRAYAAAWGRPLARIGVGGSIPFVALFARRFGDLPLILNGVMDPLTTAHGPNESMHLGVFEKAIDANVRLYWELSRALAK